MMLVLLDEASLLKGYTFFEEIGLGDISHFVGGAFRVLDKKKFLLAVMKYGIKYKEVELLNMN